MSIDSAEEFHRQHLKDATARLMKNGDLYHEIVFVKGGRRQMLVLVPFGPTRATQAAAEAIVESDEPDMVSVATLAWIKSVPEGPENYKLGDVAESADKRELLIVVTADRNGSRYTSVNEVFRDGDKLSLQERQLTLPQGMIVPEMPHERPTP